MKDYFVSLCSCPCVTSHFIYIGTYGIAGPNGCTI